MERLLFVLSGQGQVGEKDILTRYGGTPCEPGIDGFKPE